MEYEPSKVCKPRSIKQNLEEDKMSRIMCVIVGVFLVMGQFAIAVPSDEITFKTAVKAPVGFDAWTFFWQMPAIDADATLEYVVIQPDGKEYFRYKMPKEREKGTEIRSDFRLGFAGGDPGVFYDKEIIFKFSVDKGKIEFDPKATYNFEFRNTIKAIKQ